MRSPTIWDADEIVGGTAQDEEAVDPFHATKLDLALPGHCLDPAKALFDAFADALADRVAFMVGGSGVNQCAACFPQRKRPA